MLIKCVNLMEKEVKLRSQILNNRGEESYEHIHYR